ncbi:ABC transporter permease [Candidatus Protofrankia californiensis]|uniref:ABC transporter permease n=1 Tax=Candidatus Protofrankia californiensis TaxID=1839754 RepID=UPI001F49468C|nr:ABC transporter permease [Candidatus Protofrankia californiensis]
MTVLFLRPGETVDNGHDLSAAAVVATSLTAFALLFVVYYNLVTALVARREELVLKRLRSGEITDVEILVGTALPAVAIGWAQTTVGFVAAIAALDMAMPVNVLLVIAAIPLGTVVFVLLATASTAVTRTVEMAQVTTLPVLLAPLALSGLPFPLTRLPNRGKSSPT